MSNIDREHPVDAGLEQRTGNAIASLLAMLKENPGSLKTVSRADLATLSHLLDQQVEQIDKKTDEQLRAESDTQKATEKQQRQKILAEKYSISPEDTILAENTITSLKNGQNTDGSTVEIPENLARNENFALDALKANEDVWERLPEDLRLNEAFQKRALEQNAYIFQKFDAGARANENIARFALKCDAYTTYRHLPDTLRDNEDFIFSALDTCTFPEKIALLEALRGTPLESNRAFIMKGLDKGIDMTVALSGDLSNDREIFLKASELSPSAINQASRN